MVVSDRAVQSDTDKVFHAREAATGWWLPVVECWVGETMSVSWWKNGGGFSEVFCICKSGYVEDWCIIMKYVKGISEDNVERCWKRSSKIDLINKEVCDLDQSMQFIHFANVSVAVDSSHLTASSSASWSRLQSTIDFVNGHASTIWLIVCCWLQLHVGDLARRYLWRIARRGSSPVWKWFSRDRDWRGRLKPGCWIVGSVTMM